MARKKGPAGNTGSKNKTLFSWDHKAKLPLWFPCLSPKRPRNKTLFSWDHKANLPLWFPCLSPKRPRNKTLFSGLFFLGLQSQALVFVFELQKAGPQIHKFGVFALESFIHNLSIREEVYPKP